MEIMDCLKNYYLLNLHLFGSVIWNLNAENNFLFRLTYLFCRLRLPHQSSPFSILMGVGGRMDFIPSTSHCFAVYPCLLQQESADHSHGKKVVRNLEMRPFEILQRYLICAPQARYTLSAKLSDFAVWRHTWQKNWVNCEVLTGNSAGLRTVLFSRLSHKELRSSLRESHSKRQPCFYPP
jgi:hypothetical protein